MRQFLYFKCSNAHSRLKFLALCNVQAVRHAIHYHNSIHYTLCIQYAARPGQLSEYMSSCFELLMLRYDVVGRRAIQVQFSGTCAIQMFVR